MKLSEVIGTLTAMNIRHGEIEVRVGNKKITDIRVDADKGKQVVTLFLEETKAKGEKE